MNFPGALPGRPMLGQGGGKADMIRMMPGRMPQAGPNPNRPWPWHPAGGPGGPRQPIGRPIPGPGMGHGFQPGGGFLGGRPPMMGAGSGHVPVAGQGGPTDNEDLMALIEELLQQQQGGKRNGVIRPGFHPGAGPVSPNNPAGYPNKMTPIRHAPVSMRQALMNRAMHGPGV